MGEFMDAIDNHEALRPLYTEIHGLYIDLLAEALAPYALDLAISLMALEDAIDQSSPTPTDDDEIR